MGGGGWSRSQIGACIARAQLQGADGTAGAAGSGPEDLCGLCDAGPGGTRTIARARELGTGGSAARQSSRLGREGGWGGWRHAGEGRARGGRALVAEGLDLNIRKCRSCSGRGKAPAHVAPSRRAARGRRGLEPVPMPGLASDHCMVCTACSAVQPSRPWARSHGSGAEQAPQRSRSEWARVASPRGPCFSRWAGMAGSARRDRPGDAAARGLQHVHSGCRPAVSCLCAARVRRERRGALVRAWMSSGLTGFVLANIRLVSFGRAHIRRLLQALFCQGKKNLALDEPDSTVHPNIIHLFANTAEL